MMERNCPTSEQRLGRRIKVLVLIPTLDVGGAEMDVARNLPVVDRSRFEVVVCAFLARGLLAAPLTEAGIEVIGPLMPRVRPRRFRAWLSKLQPGARLLAALRRVGLNPRAWRWLPARPRRWLPRRRWQWLPSRPWQYLLAILPLTFLRPAVSYVRTGAAIADIMRDRKIDVVHAILPNAYLAGAIACVLTEGRPLVMSRVSLNWYQKKIRMFSLIERRILHRIADAVICNSAAISRDLLAEGVSRAKIRLIPNGIDLGMFSRPGLDRNRARDQLGIPHDAMVFSLVANFHVYKGHDDLIRALHLVRDQLPPGWLLLAPGRDIGGNLDRTRNLCEELGLSTHVHFLGELGDMVAVLLAADIHISASHTEGFPNNILEAMCAGLPVVATAVGGVPEMVIDGVTGLLVTAQEPQKMGSALVQLVRDPALRRSMGEAGRNCVVSRYSIERSVDALQETYAEVAARGGSKRHRSASP